MQTVLCSNALARHWKVVPVVFTLLHNSSILYWQSETCMWSSLMPSNKESSNPRSRPIQTHFNPKSLAMESKSLLETTPVLSPLRSISVRYWGNRRDSRVSGYCYKTTLNPREPKQNVSSVERKINREGARVAEGGGDSTDCKRPAWKIKWFYVVIL